MSTACIPVILQYMIVSGFYAETGPQLGVLVSAKDKDDFGSSNFSDQTYKIDFAWGAGAGYHLSKQFGVNVRYNLSLNTYNINDVDMRNSVLQGGASYVFRAAARGANVKH